MPYCVAGKPLLCTLNFDYRHKEIDIQIECLTLLEAFLFFISLISSVRYSLFHSTIVKTTLSLQERNQRARTMVCRDHYYC